MSFQAPRFDIPPPVAETIAALPETATCLGMFFNDVFDTVAQKRPDVDLFAIANIKKRRYFPFLSYPYADMLTIMSAGSRLVHPRVSHGEALRRMGVRAYSRLAETKVGQLVFGALGGDVKRVLLAGPRGYSLSSNFGELTAEVTGEKQIVYRFRNMPSLLETYQVGVIEGGLEAIKAIATVRVSAVDIANADIQITWE